jgi:hypothetical protein
MSTSSEEDCYRIIMYVCMSYEYINTYMCVYMCIYTYTHTHTTCVCTCVYIHTHTHTYIHTHTCTNMHKHTHTMSFSQRPRSLQGSQNWSASSSKDVSSYAVPGELHVCVCVWCIIRFFTRTSTVCVCVYVCTQGVCVYIHSVCVCVCVCLVCNQVFHKDFKCVCFLYIYIYIYIYVYIYTHTQGLEVCVFGLCLISLLRLYLGCSYQVCVNTKVCVFCVFYVLVGCWCIFHTCACMHAYVHTSWVWPWLHVGPRILL